MTDVIKSEVKKEAYPPREKQDYSHIFIDNRSAFQVGKIRIFDGQLAFKNQETGEIDQYTIEDDVKSATWFRASRGYSLRLILNKSNEIKTYIGFSKSDFEKIKEYFPELSRVEYGTKGWNFGEISVNGPLFSFNDVQNENVPLFNIDLANVANCTSVKNELSLDLHPNDEAVIDLVEIGLGFSESIMHRTLEFSYFFLLQKNSLLP